MQMWSVEFSFKCEMRSMEETLLPNQKWGCNPYGGKGRRVDDKAQMSDKLRPQ
jgi:hypothetical protein